jgi:enoyl-CoA hydratase/carnithine racemase
LSKKRERRGTAAPVLYDKEGPVAVVSLNRPDVLNAYDVGMRDGLYDALQAVRDDPEVRVLVLRGNGPSFSTGGDLSEFGTAPSPVIARHARWARDVWGLLRRLRQPSIAAVHGHVFGGGWEMAMLCDLCIASADALFCFPETGLGMIPGVGGTQTAPRFGGVGRALDWVLTGRRLPAAELHDVGVVLRVVGRHELDPAAMALAAQLAALDPAVVARVKRAVWGGIEAPLAVGLALEARLARLPLP